MENEYQIKPASVAYDVVQTGSSYEGQSSLDVAYDAGLEKVCLEDASCRFE